MLRGAIPAADQAGPFAFGDAGGIVFYAVIILYSYLLMTQFLLAMGSKPASTITLYRILLVFWIAGEFCRMNRVGITFCLPSRFPVMGLVMYLILFFQYQIFTAALDDIMTNGFLYVLKEVNDLRCRTSSFQMLNFSLRLRSQNQPFSSLFVAIWACWGIWFIAGVLFLDPWHLIHSLFQFILTSIFWTNCLQVYAMSNIHDVSWGTKGDTKAHTLGSAKPVGAKKDDEPPQVELELPDADQVAEANRIYEQQLASLALPSEATKESGFLGWRNWFPRPPIPDEEENFKRYRTVILWLWATTNLAVVLVFTNGFIEDAMMTSSGLKLNPYVIFLFYATVGFAAIKLLGLVWHLLFQRLFDRRETVRAEYLGNVLAKRPAFRSQASFPV